jgi:hypothetical protein
VLADEKDRAVEKRAAQIAAVQQQLAFENFPFALMSRVNLPQPRQLAKRKCRNAGKKKNAEKFLRVFGVVGKRSFPRLQRLDLFHNRRGVNAEVREQFLRLAGARQPVTASLWTLMPSTLSSPATASPRPPSA